MGREAKCLEIRDSATFIPVVCVKLEAQPAGEAGEYPGDYLMRRAGYNAESHQVLVHKLQTGQGRVNVEEWNGCRTMTVAHQYIVERWHLLRDGDVVDVEHILGETTARKTSERYSSPA